jgi:hypothetical protein
MNWKNIVLMAVLLLFVSSISAMAEVEGKDLGVLSYSVMPKPAVVGEPVEVTLTIKNMGTENIHENFVIEFQACKPGGFSCHIPEGAEVQGLAIGEEKSFLKKFNIKESDVVNGQSIIRFVVDGDGHVDEVDETNNIYSMLIDVVEEAPIVEVSGGPVKFSVAVNDYPDNQDYDLSKNLKFAYVNMYTVELEEDAFKVVSYETKYTGKAAAAIFTVEVGEMVYFEGFKTKEGAKEGAVNKQALLWSLPPFKNFGTEGDNVLYQTHWTETDEFLKHDKDYAGSSSLSVPYQDLDNEIVEPVDTVEPVEQIKLKVKSTVKEVKLDWNDLSGLGDTFDKYNIQLKKGKSLGEGHGNSFVSFSYYNFMNLNAGDYWTFKVCPTKNKEIVGGCSNTVTVLIQDTTEIVEEDIKDETVKYSIWTYDNGKSVRSSVAKYRVDPNNHFKSKLVEVKPAVLTEDYKGNKFYQAKFDVKEDEIVAFVSFQAGLTPLKTIDNIKTYPGYHNVLVNNGLKNSFGTQALCKYAQKACGGITGEGQQILFSVDAENVDHVPFVKVPTPIVIPGNSKPDFDKIIPEYQFVECPSGCSYEGKCLPVGTKIKENGDSLFCDWNGDMKDQLPVGKICQNDYECGSNSCMSGKCLDLEKKLEEQQNLLNRILHWLENFFK